MTEPLLSVTPSSLTLSPGELAQVTVTVDPDSPSGEGVVSVAVTVPPQYDYLISGNIGPLTIGPNETAHIVGDFALTSDIFVEGLLTGADTFHCQGNGFSIFFQNGGRVDLAGKVKAAWGEWGTDTTGWVAGDRIAVAATKAGIFVPSELVWSDWSIVRPVNSPDVTLVDGTVAKPEVVNLSQSAVFENLARGFHFHDSAGIQTLSDVKFLNCGTAGVLGNYPVHFHLLGDNSRGSVLTRVVVEGGKNHAFVPHGSHGIDFLDCVAYKTVNDAYWWDPPAGNPANHSNDIHYHHALALSVDPSSATPHSVSGFELGSGTGNECVDSVAACVRGGNNAAGFSWQETSNQPPNVWLFDDNLAHNSPRSGIRVWQNNDDIHLVSRFIGYRNQTGINHGAYRNRYHYAGVVLTANTFAVRTHALTTTSGNILFEDILSDGPLQIDKHNNASSLAVIYRRCTFPTVLMRESSNGGINPGIHRFEDCDLTPTDFDLAGILAGSIIEIYEAGTLTNCWAGGWT